MHANYLLFGSTTSALTWIQSSSQPGTVYRNHSLLSATTFQWALRQRIQHEIPQYQTIGHKRSHQTSLLKSQFVLQGSTCMLLWIERFLIPFPSSPLVMFRMVIGFGVQYYGLELQHTGNFRWLVMAQNYLIPGLLPLLVCHRLVSILLICFWSEFSLAVKYSFSLIILIL